MPFSNYTELKQAVSDWMARADVLGNAADFIALGEAGLNRALDAVDMNETLTGETGIRDIDVSYLGMVSPIAMFLAVTGGDVPLVQRAAGTFAFSDVSGPPSIWSVDGCVVVFDRLLDQPYTFRFRYKQRFALSDAAPTNWLLTKHPDLYLAAAVVWGGVFVQDGGYAASFKAVLDETIPAVRSTIAQSRRGVLTVDPALSAFNNRSIGREYL